MSKTRFLDTKCRESCIHHDQNSRDLKVDSQKWTLFYENHRVKVFRRACKEEFSPGGRPFGRYTRGKKSDFAGSEDSFSGDGRLFMSDPEGLEKEVLLGERAARIEKFGMPPEFGEEPGFLSLATLAKALYLTLRRLRQPPSISSATYSSQRNLYGTFSQCTTSGTFDPKPRLGRDGRIYTSFARRPATTSFRTQLHTEDSLSLHTASAHSITQRRGLSSSTQRLHTARPGVYAEGFPQRTSAGR